MKDPQQYVSNLGQASGINLCTGSANERRRYNVTSSLIN